MSSARPERRLPDAARSRSSGREYLLKLEGFDIGEQGSKDVPPELLEEVFELNMALEEMRGGDATARPQLEQAESNFTRMMNEVDERLQALFEKYDSAPRRETLAEIRGVSEPAQIYSESARRSPRGVNASNLIWKSTSENPSTVVGIDLGTTNSLVAFMDLTGPRIIPGADGDQLVPSVVSISRTAKSWSGIPRANCFITQPERTVYSVKRLMGRGSGMSGGAEALSVSHRAEAASR